MKRIISAIAATLLMTGCVTLVTLPPTHTPTKTSLELQVMQSRDFDIPKRVVFASTMSVFQDLGYSISASDLDTGYISAKSPTQHKVVIGHRAEMRDTKATAFIEEFRPGITRVRLSFTNTLEWSTVNVAKLLQEYPIEDATVYNNAFIKIQESIFIRTGTN